MTLANQFRDHREQGSCIRSLKVRLASGEVVINEKEVDGSLGERKFRDVGAKAQWKRGELQNRDNTSVGLCEDRHRGVSVEYAIHGGLCPEGSTGTRYTTPPHETQMAWG